jgi:hypothetical protein
MLVLEIAVFGTIAAAVAAWAVAECLESRVAWTIGAILSLVHSLAAFASFYDFRHDIARSETVRQTAALTGIEFSGGIYINYLFLAVWAADAAWWWINPRAYARRPRGLSLSIRAFIFFIIVNGAVVFADGWARSIGIAAVAAVLGQAYRDWITGRAAQRT